MKTVLIADDHPVYLLGLKTLLETQFSQDFSLSGMASNVDELLSALKNSQPDLLLTDFTMPGNQQSDGLHLIQYLRRTYPTLPIVVISVLSNQAIVNVMLKAGVIAVINKQSLGTELNACLKSLSMGLVIPRNSHPQIEKNPQYLSAYGQLSPKESEVLRLLNQGQTVNQIAQMLHRSKQTISGQKKSAMNKLSLSTDAELFEYLLKMDL
ncbi:DNA-binding response regulator [Rouxiella silvae]|uniref:DNA-binding response regulator n=1 Tax=Rouxiella silvae TaxID=1646373 RepID=A0AA40X1V0_9GAMM|nr:response regulator transcription factor [Rouxiella silvae]MBF6636909.1 response regulator transcription factor [Rouxiella silvae]ORJ22237.1 DNA-binding response regulator [Rouxiella silvae]